MDTQIGENRFSGIFTKRLQLYIPPLFIQSYKDETYTNIQFRDFMKRVFELHDWIKAS